MSTLAISAYQRLGEIFGNSPPLEKESESKVASVMQKVLDAKQSHVKAALGDKWKWNNVVLIGGDVFTSLYLVFQAALSFRPSLVAIPAVAVAGLIAGVIAGFINTGVGVVSGVEAFQAFLNGDTKLGLRLALDCLCYTSIGVIMILASLAIKVAALGTIGAFFAAHPWFLPVLFFAASIPLLIELGSKIGSIAISQDLGSQLKLNELEKELRVKNPNWEKIKQLYAGAENPFKKEEEIQPLTEKMESLQADMGVEAAVEVFKLLKLIEEKNQAASLKQIEIAREKIEEWNRSLYLRMSQQVLYIIGFGLSMGALTSSAPHLLNGVQSSFLALANAIPFYMDTWWPFKRNTPIVVPKVEAAEITA